MSPFFCFFRFGARPCFALIAALLALSAGAHEAHEAHEAHDIKPALASLRLNAEPSLAVALDAAWNLTARSRSLANRQAEIDAREQVANSVLAGTPSVTLSQRSDRLQTNRGLRNDEVGLAFPLWRVGVRAATVTQIDSDRAALFADDLSSKLKLASELRDLVASAALNRLERDLAEHKHEDAQVLLQDTQRRVKSGERPRIDALQASAAERLAAVQLAQADAARVVLQAQWRALTGLVQLSNPEVSVVNSAAEHPRLLAANARVRAAQTRLALTEVDKRDAPEVGVGLTRERALSSDAAQNALRLSLRIPFGGAHRNAPRLSAARAELDTAEADRDAVQRQVQADFHAAQAGLLASQAAQSLATERAALSAEAQALVAKAYQLGESDLPTRLRTDHEGFEAQLALARARAETQRAIARLNQSSGQFP